MSDTFKATLRTLASENRARRSLYAVLAISLLAAWFAWFFLDHLTLYETSSRAQLMVNGSAHTISASVAGPLIFSDLHLGREVSRGDVLLRLDSARERLELESRKATLCALQEDLAGVRQQITIAEQAMKLSLSENRWSVAASLARIREKEAVQEAAQRRFQALEALDEGGVTSPEKLADSHDIARAREAQTNAARAEKKILENNIGVKQLDRKLTLSQLRKLRSTLSGQVEIARIEIQRLAHEVTLRVIRASEDGIIAFVGTQKIGDFIEPADVLARILPRQPPRVIAYFPAACVGRIHDGQSGRFLLDAFPWMRYGAPGVRVIAVGNEAEHGEIRVEMELLERPENDALPLNHGQTGSIEIAVESLTPFDLVLRSATRKMTTTSTQREPGLPRTREAP